MNLAEIRKKAQREKEKPGEQTIPAPRMTEHAGIIAGDIPEILDPLPDEVLPEVVLLTDLAGAEAGEECPPPVYAPGEVCKEDKTAPVYDPLALLMAGRESACLEEKQTLSATAPQQYSGAALQEFLCFRVANETYAISIMDIKEIIKPREVTEVPRVPEFVAGVLSLRGIILPVFHMRHRLGLPPAGTSGKERTIVVKKGEDYCGLFVDEVIQVVKIAAEMIEQPPAVLDGIDRDFVVGIGRHDGQMLILLNLEKVLDVTLC